MDELSKRFSGRTLGVATVHEKERVIGPALMRALPLGGVLPIAGIDTDRFGAFSGEVQRTDDPLTSCIKKARHGAEVSGMDLVVASEGSFAPYPPAPFISCNEEFLVLLDVRDETVFHHRHVTLETVFGGERCSTWGHVQAFAERMKFPEHQLVVRVNEKWERGEPLHKGIRDTNALRDVTEAIIDEQGSCWVETDMRAMANPTRMKMIGTTAEGFARELASLCPACATSWFRIDRGDPRTAVRALRLAYARCTHIPAELSIMRP